MTKKDVKDLERSVHQRLLNISKERSRPFNEVLQFFAIERLIFRLTKTPHADRFILKGALMFPVWGGAETRPTMDIDMLGKIDNSLDVITDVVKDSCVVAVEPDGMTFDGDSIDSSRITEDADYEGVRVIVRGSLGKAKVTIQVDIGFGDEVSPGPIDVSYPTLLDFTAPALKGYTMESVVSEKFQTMVKLGVLNSRMKDFYDIWALSNRFAFAGESLSEAISRTFRNRDTELTPFSDVFDEEFVTDPVKQIQWQGFLKKTKLSDAPDSFPEVVEEIRKFLGPIMEILAEGEEFSGEWEAGSSWK